MLHQLKKKEKSLKNEYRHYRFCGYLFFILNAALIGVVFQIIHHDLGYQYSGLFIYVVALYTFTCLTIAIVNVFIYRKLNRPVLSAVKAISLVKALVAMYSLQTAMLTSFGGDEIADLKYLMNSLSGGVLCLYIFILAVFMIIQANKKIKVHT
jgi:hypothetical protein